MTDLDKLARGLTEARQVPLHRRIVMGAGYIDGYGEHPGTGLVVALILITALAGGASGGDIGFIGGAVIATLIYGPMWICGCVGRANAALKQHIERTERE